MSNPLRAGALASNRRECLIIVGHEQVHFHQIYEALYWPENGLTTTWRHTYVHLIGQKCSAIYDFFSQVTSWIFFKNKVHFWTSNLHDIPVFNFINYKTGYRMPCNYWNQMNYSFKGGFQFSKIIKIWFNL